MTSLPASPAPSDPDSPGPSAFRQKLPPERIALIRDWVECTTRSFKTIGRELGVSPATVSRYAAEGGWQRPPGAAPAPIITRRNPDPARRRKSAPQGSGSRRERLTETLWRLAERHAEDLEEQPIARAGRSLHPLARLTRTLGEIDRHLSPPPAAPEYDIDAPKPRRTIHELRDELAGHLERIEREERDFEERWGRTFEDGGGI